MIYSPAVSTGHIVSELVRSDMIRQSSRQGGSPMENEHLTARLRRTQLAAFAASLISLLSLITGGFAIFELNEAKAELARIVSKVNDHDGRIDQLESDKTDLDDRLEAVETRLHM